MTHSVESSFEGNSIRIITQSLLFGQQHALMRELKRRCIIAYHNELRKICTDKMERRYASLTPIAELRQRRGLVANARCKILVENEALYNDTSTSTP